MCMLRETWEKNRTTWTENWEIKERVKRKDESKTEGEREGEINWAKDVCFKEHFIWTDHAAHEMKIISCRTTQTRSYDETKHTRSTNKCVRLWRAAVGWWIERIDLNSNTLDYEPIRLLLLLIKRPLWNEQMQVVIGRRSVFNTKSSITFKKYYWYGAQNRCD